MALVSYSDSEGSDDEHGSEVVQSSTKIPKLPPAISSFVVNKTQPNVIKVNLQHKTDPLSTDSHDDEPAAKRPRVGAGVFSGFNSMLPAPKRDNMPAVQNGGKKSAARKIFSLKTGAEAAFSRESDAELRNLFAEQDDEIEGTNKADITIPTVIPKPTFAKPPAPIAGGNPFLFKPLSVARNQKKKTAGATTKVATLAQRQTAIEVQPTSAQSESTTTEMPKKKISLFSVGVDAVPVIPEYDEEDHLGDEHDPLTSHESIDETSNSDYAMQQQYTQPTDPGSQSLDNIASELNLSRAERRQLFGRDNKSSGTQALNIVNFNTDAEYAANQQLIAAGETVQHNPVRGIAPGKHSLRQLVNAASGQKEALEESFAQGKRNKKEAGNKYGW